MKTELKIFDLTRSASWDEIKKAYRQKMKKCHPDLQGSDSSKIDSANKESQDVNAAYEKLKMCLSQTGKFICPVMTFIKRPSAPSDLDSGKTNIIDFFKPKDIQTSTQSGSGVGFLFNLAAITLWLGVLFAGTVKAVEYFGAMH
jgi:hypothetical protein